MTTAVRAIPLARPTITEAEIDAVGDVLRSGNLAQGERVAQFEAAFAAYVGCAYAVATSSGTTALHLALLALGIGPGDEVITTPFTFVATASSIAHTGARPIFADIDPETLNLAPAAVRDRITPRTRAIMPVHLYGNPCDMPALKAIARDHGLALVEDACQAHGAESGGRRVGSSGTACFSFYATKNMTTGEGGMICTADGDLAERASLLRNHGMLVPYRHDALGYNFRLTDVHAAIGLAQLSRLDTFNRERRDNAAYYDAHLIGARRPSVYPDTQSAWHQYTLLVEPARRDAVVARLRRGGVGVGIYYPLPVHRQPIAERLGLSAQCPAADVAAASVLSIPVHASLSRAERRYVVAEVNSALSGT
jgi:dTDP-4-amino-4,6-dideoxygalactose transaminase